jgi:hypothetical protein
MTDHPPLLSARTIGKTENTLRALLTNALDGTGLDYPDRGRPHHRHPQPLADSSHRVDHRSCRYKQQARRTKRRGFI